MPLTKSVKFKAVLQKGNRVQVPRLVRWEFKVETGQVLRVSVSPAGYLGTNEVFFGRMNGDGRVTIPKLSLGLLQDRTNEGKSLVGEALDVELEPAGKG